MNTAQRFSVTFDEPAGRTLPARFNAGDLSEYGMPMPVCADLAASRIARAQTSRRKSHLYYLAALSRDPDAARAFAAFLLERFGDSHLGSRTMRELGAEAGREYVGEDFENVCRELDFHPLGHRRKLFAQISADNDRIAKLRELFGDLAAPSSSPRLAEIKNDVRGLECRVARIREKLQPERRRASVQLFVDHCKSAARRLPAMFYSFVMQRDPNEPWSLPFFTDFEDALDRAIEAHAHEVLAAQPCTKANTAVMDAIENAAAHRHMVWLAGEERTGKSTGATILAKARPDRVVVVSCVSGSEDRNFFAEFARAVGCSVGPDEKPGELKLKIVDAVRNGDQVVVLDEALILFGAGRRPTPRRADWLRTAILNLGVPVVLIFTGQMFIERIRELRKFAEWNSKQFEGRRGAFYFAPEPTLAELLKVANHYLAGSQDDSLQAASAAAFVSEHRLPALIRIADDAANIAKQQGRDSPTAADVDAAIGKTMGFDELMRKVERGELDSQGRSKRIRTALEPQATPAPAPAADQSQGPFGDALSRLNNRLNDAPEAVVAGAGG